MNKLFTFFVHATYKLRMVFDCLIYHILKKYNHWEILDELMDKNVLVVGNGPSLKRTELDKIDMVSIGMNKINLLFDKTTWRPDIITCVNGLVTRQNAKFFNSTDIILVLPARAWYLGVKKRRNVLFVKAIDSGEFRNDIQNGVGYSGATVTFTALQIAAYLRPKSVNIVGVDHNFKNCNYETPSEIRRYEGDDDDHFDPNYFKGSLWGLPDLAGSEIAYKSAKYYYDTHNIPIIDYTIDGKCQVFKKDDVNKIYKK